MNLLTTAKNLLFGGDGKGAVGSIIDAVQDYFPPSMSEAEKAQLSMRIKDAEHQRNMDLMDRAAQMVAAFNDRIKAMEGTAKDLAQFGLIGRVIVFLRGLQRPAFGFMTLWADVGVFTGRISITMQTPSMFRDGQLVPGSWTPEGVAFVGLNFLVLTFLFGERAIKNVMPIVLEFFRARGLMREEKAAAK
ncbi:hypothetical protein JCM16814_08390 [Desulfobaculum senezii]|jgi:hypothetical protein